MGVKGNRNGVSWSDTDESDKVINSGWSQDAVTPYGKSLFRLYYDNGRKSIYLLDITEEVTYEVPMGDKAKGYILALKLYKNYSK